MNKSLLAAAAAAVAVIMTGCAQIEDMARAKPAPISPFLEKPELLVRQKPSFPFHYFYLKENAGSYKYVYVAPVNTQYLQKNTNWAEMDQKIAKQIGSDIPKIADFMRNAYQNEFKNARGTSNLKVVSSPDQDKTLIVETAIITIVPTKAELVVLGTVGNFFLPGIGIITGNLATGSITIECIIRDAKTKEIIAMYANTEKDQHAILNFAGMTWYTSAENNIKKQADYTARVFSGSDYSVLRRRLIKIIEF